MYFCNIHICISQETSQIVKQCRAELHWLTIFHPKNFSGNFLCYNVIMFPCLWSPPSWRGVKYWDNYPNVRILFPTSHSPFNSEAWTCHINSNYTTFTAIPMGFQISMRIRWSPRQCRLKLKNLCNKRTAPAHCTMGSDCCETDFKRLDYKLLDLCQCFTF